MGPSDDCQFPLLGKACAQWAVVTTIFAPTEAVKRVASLKNWCTVIVADTKTPDNYFQQLTGSNASFENNSDIVYLSVEAQQQINNCFVTSTPFQSFARKNVGYLYAIRHGAQVIFDFDDDNILKLRALEKHLLKPAAPWTIQPNIGPRSIRARVKVPVLSNNSSLVVNPYLYMGPSVTDTWPRGLPLEYVKHDVADLNTLVGDMPIDHVGIIQFVADGNPDVDAIYRLTKTIPFTFQDDLTSLKLLIPQHTYAPYNAQATLHFYNSFWGALLPVTVTGRVSDIWRSYFTQRIMHGLDIGLVFAPPVVVQERNAHNYLADMDAEWDLYMKTQALVQFLSEWEQGRDIGASTVNPSLPLVLERLWVALYERGYIELADVEALQQWLRTLVRIGYQFPSLEHEDKSLSFVEQPTLHGQPFTAFPVYNVGGSNGETFQEYVSKHQSESNAWEQWLNGASVHNSLRPAHRILKIVLMTKDECPPLKEWTMYHGKLVGFHNLYIIDGSTDDHCTWFLLHARDSLGVNVIFSPADLNEIEKELNVVMGSVAGSSDFMIKLDTDEFVALYDESRTCGDVDSLRKNALKSGNSSCVVSPHGVGEHLDSMELDGSRFMVGPCAYSIPNEVLCESGLGDDLGIQYFGIANGLAKGLPKVFFDSRTFTHVDLGSHFGSSSVDNVRPSQISIIHFHSRCFEQEVASCRKAVIGHKYISETDTEEEALQKLKDKWFGSETCRIHGEKFPLISSYHKVVCYAANLTCKEEYKTQFYKSAESAIHTVNPHFYKYLNDAMREYASY